MSNSTNTTGGGGTPFISVLEPTRLDGYDRSKGPDAQPPSIPRTFVDSMEVREAVFVKEQGVPLEHEYDEDDARSVHLVIYASVQHRVDQQQQDEQQQQPPPPERVDADGNVVRPRRSETRTTPIGTLRIVPFPHPPHPVAGGRYADNQLLPPRDGGETALHHYRQHHTHSEAGQQADEARQCAPLPYGRDRPTTFHDGTEPYVKLGRLAVVKEFRGHRIAGQLWAAARDWLQSHPDYFNPSVAELGMEALHAAGASQIPRWRGLVCVHAQVQVERVWARWGFCVDEGMGRWEEEGMQHVGMFQRLAVKDAPARVL